MVSVAFSDKYFDSLLKLTPNEQSQANKAVMQFQNDPHHSSLNYEKLKAFKDNKIRSIRANQEVRIILAASEGENLYLMLYVDHHEPAYKWASNRKVEINPNTGTVQIFNVQEKELPALRPEPVKEVMANIFDHVRDRQLLQLGVPEDALELIRSIKTEAQLEFARESDQLPADAYDGLFMLMAGASFEEAYNEAVPLVPEQVDTTNFSEALQRPESLAHFAVADDEQALNDVLNQSLDKWRVFLHPKQRRLARGDKNGPVRVLGGAGTGKTVVAMHRAKWLASNFGATNKKVLFTTFTRNLARDIEQNLQKICSSDELSRIEVMNLDAWVVSFLKKHGYDYGLLLNSKLEKQLWNEAFAEKPANLDLDLAFFQEEWSRVVQPQSISSVEEYKHASRLGRGTRLNRKQRIEIWPVFEQYRHLLTSNHLKETDDVYRDARSLLESRPDLRPNLSSIIVDEAQDMGTQAFMLIRAIIPAATNDLFIVGDGHQRIYGKNKVVLGQCGIDIRGRSARLKINYRTTDETRKLAVGILEGVEVDDLDGGQDDQSYYHSLIHGPQPEITRFDSMEQQCQRIIEVIKAQNLDPEACCVVARTRYEVNAIKDWLMKNQQMVNQIDGSANKTPEGALNIATMHRVKGLEFDAVFLASANKGLIPLTTVLNSSSDAVTYRQRENEERALIYVSLTRARKLAYVFGYGHMSEWFSSNNS
jgi:superfamily I DNA/RNA helicase/mRNA-degrading endonuclease RelE of RelBE toxin-antitoxin system